MLNGVANCTYEEVDFVKKAVVVFALAMLAGSMFALPDLVASATGTGGDKTVGIPFTVNVTTSNIGQPQSGLSTTRAVFASDIRNINVPKLKPGKSYSQLLNFNCTQAGTFSLDVTADVYSQVAESNENNNFVSYPVNCVNPPPPPMPDLVSELAVVGNFSDNVTHYYYVSVVTRNIGQATAGASVTWTSYNSVPQSYNVPSLAPSGSSTTFRTVACLPESGNRTFYSYADSTYVVSESNEGNNGASLAIPACPA